MPSLPRVHLNTSATQPPFLLSIFLISSPRTALDAHFFSRSVLDPGLSQSCLTFELGDLLVFDLDLSDRFTPHHRKTNPSPSKERVPGEEYLPHCQYHLLCPSIIHGGPYRLRWKGKTVFLQEGRL